MVIPLQERKPREIQRTRKVEAKKKPSNSGDYETRTDLIELFTNQDQLHEEVLKQTRQKQLKHQKKKEAKTRRVGRRTVNRNVIREKPVTKNRVIDIATIEENVTEIEKLTVTRIVNASAHERRRVTANQRVKERATLSPQMKNERIRAKLKNARVNQMRQRKQLENDTSIRLLPQTSKAIVLSRLTDEHLLYTSLQKRFVLN